MRQTIFCNHYQAMFDHKTCKAGVAYEKFKGTEFKKHPCFCKNGVVNPGCELQAFPTPEEIAKEEAEFEALFARTNTARKAIVEKIGGPWKKGMPSVSGVMDCPVCSGKESLHYSRAGYNGHIHTRCTTKDCVAWME